MVRITVTIGERDARTERVIEIDPDDIPMQFYLDLENVKENDKQMTAVLKTYAEVIGFTLEEAGQLSRRDWKRVTEAVTTTADEAVEIPNGKT